MYKIHLFVCVFLAFFSVSFLSCEKEEINTNQPSQPVTIYVHIQKRDPNGHYFGAANSFVDVGVSWTAHMFGGFTGTTDSDGNISKTIDSEGNEAHAVVVKVIHNGNTYWVDDDYVRETLKVKPGNTGHITIKLN